ncbi:MAG: acylphosphatase [Planctomycetales bacterium]
MTGPHPPGEGSARRRCVYHGRVQGVGFRATTASIARRHPVTGYVRNRADGTVELVLDGPPQAVGEALGEIELAMCGYIDRRDDADLEMSERFERFEIRR